MQLALGLPGQPVTLDSNRQRRCKGRGGGTSYAQQEENDPTCNEEGDGALFVFKCRFCVQYTPLERSDRHCKAERQTRPGFSRPHIQAVITERRVPVGTPHGPHKHAPKYPLASSSHLLRWMEQNMVDFCMFQVVYACCDNLRSHA